LQTIQKMKLMGIFLFVAVLVSSFTYFISEEPNIQTFFDTLDNIVLLNKEKAVDILEGYSISQINEIDLNSLAQSGEKALNNSDFNKVKSEDNQYLTLAADGKPLYQRYRIKIEKDSTESSKVQLKWLGKSNRNVSIYGWDFTKNSWVMLNSTVGRKGGDSTVTVDLDYNTMVQNSAANIIVGTDTKNNILQGKVPGRDEYDFTLAWLTDTQYYSTSYPDIYNKMTKYIVDNARKQNIVYAIHTGDVVDNMDDVNQWENADKSMKLLDKAGIPYGVSAGNHDVGHSEYNYSQFYKYFGEDRFKNMATYGGSPNNNRDHYDIVSAYGRSFIILYLGWHIDESSIQWANEILKKNSDKMAIVATHGYISPRGTYIEEGSLINDKIVAPNKNVFLVLCGHYPGVTINQKRSVDHIYYEMLSDYQFNPEGGAGYLRMLRFDNSNNRIYVETYSPYKNDYNYYDDSKEQFVIPLNPESGEGNLNTDNLEIYISKN